MSLKIAKNMQFIMNTNATRLIISKDQTKNTFGSSISHKDAEYNVLGNEEYERITTFNMMFITVLFRHDYFRFDEQGNLLLENYDDDALMVINTETFEIPTLDEIYGY